MIKKLQCTVIGVGNCMARTNGTELWFNSESPIGCSFIPESQEDIDIFNNVKKYGEIEEIDL